MSIFTAEDEDRILTIHYRRINEDKKLFFEYFSDIAVEEITKIIWNRKEELLSNIEQHACRYSSRNIRQFPILIFKSYRQTSIRGKARRRYLQEVNSDIVPGSYFKSSAGIHIVDLSAIYRHSDFCARVNDAIGSNMFYISLTSNQVSENDNVREYENTLWLNVRV
jgi:hypothetical protein